MLKSCVTAGLIMLSAASCAFGDECELQYQNMDMGRQGIYVAGQRLGASTRSVHRLSREPKYRSKIPIYAVAEFGNGSDRGYTMVFDESKGKGRGYDILYFDRNNNKDLTDDPPIAGQVQRQNYIMGKFDPLEVMIDYSDRTVSLYFSIEYIIYGDQRIVDSGGPIRNMFVRLQNIGCYTGLVPLGDTKRPVTLIDYNGNGLFNDYFISISAGSSVQFIYGSGDEMLIDVNGDGKFERGNTGNAELYPCSKYVQSDGKWYSLNVSDHGGSIEVNEPRLKLGFVKIPNLTGPCSLELLSDEGVLKLFGNEEAFQVPEGTYQFLTSTVSSEGWQYQTRGRTSDQKLRIQEGKSLDLPLGPPIRVDVKIRNPRTKAGQTSNLTLSISGQGGEVYTSVLKNGGRPPAPTFKVVDERGKVVANGTFKYG